MIEQFAPQQPEETENAPGAVAIGCASGEGDLGVYANHLVVQQDEHEFILNFFQLSPPVTLGAEPPQGSLENKVALHARPVARIIVSKSRMVEFAKVMQHPSQRRLSADDLTHLCEEARQRGVSPQAIYVEEVRAQAVLDAISPTVQELVAAPPPPEWLDDAREEKVY